MRLNLRPAGPPVLVLLLVLAGCTPRGAEALRRGDQALAANRPAEAVPLLERAVTDLPNDAVAWNQLGLAYQATGRPDEARKAYLRALQFDRNLFDVYFNLGALEYEARRWADAERALRTYLGIESNRSNTAAWRMLADAQIASGQWDIAERTLATALQVGPNDAALRNSLGLSHARKRRWRDAQMQFAHAVRVSPDHAGARLNLAVATQQLGDRRAALEHYRAFLELNAPPAEAEAVRTQILQLEAALAPPPVVSTNLVSLRTNPPTNAVRIAPSTNPVVAAVPQTTNLPPTRVATNIAVSPPPRPPATPPSTSSVPTIPEPPAIVRPPPTIEIVQVEDPPRLQVARDLEPSVASTSSASAGATSPPVREVVMAAASSGRATSPPADQPTAQSTDTRRSFWQRMNPATWGNPLNWFRGTDRPAEGASANPDSAPTTITEPTVLPPRTTTPTNEPAPATRAAPQKPIVPKYPRRASLDLTPGNRAAAEAAAGQLTSDRLGSFQRAVQLDPSWSAGWQQVGRLALESGRVPLALQAGEAAVTLEPNSAVAHQLFAAALARAGYPADAAEELERALSATPGNAATHLAVAGLYARELGEPNLARPHYEKVLELDPQHPLAGAIRVWLASNP